jgi:glucosyl-dolichyl phosphate glucuronosyltransferase
MIELSIIICSHNVPDSLFYELKTIMNQECLENVEVVIVNNGFQTEKEEQIYNLLAKSVPNFQITREPKPGLGFARRQGFTVAKGKYLILLDADNSIDTGFIKTLLVITRKYPDLGGIVPVVMPVWEKNPPNWLVKFGTGFLSYNAYDDYKPLSGDCYFRAEDAYKIARPPGGGMILHRQVAFHYLEKISDPTRIALSRQPKSLVGCEDDDYWAGLKELRLPVFFSDRLRVFHHVPESRIHYRYLMNLVYMNGYSYGMLDQYRRPENMYTTLFETKILFLHTLRRTNSLIKRDTNIQIYFLMLLHRLGLMRGHLKKIS